MPPSPPIARQPQDEHPWKETARRVAWVAGVYCAVVAIILIVSYFRCRSFDPVDHRELAALKAELVRNPVDEALMKKIRALDLDLRRQYLGYLGRVQNAGWMLLGGALVLLPALHFTVWRKRLPRPGKYVLKPELAERDAAISRWGVGMVGFALAGLAAVLVNSSHSELSEALAANRQPAPAKTNGVQQVQSGSSLPTAEEIAQNWPRFRGPHGSGVSAFTNIPTAWNVETGEGIVWKAAVPFPSPNSPVVWGNRIFMTGANSQRSEAYCFDAADGKLLWTKPVGKVPPPGTPPPNPEDEEGRYFASSTGATDGRRFYVIFETADVAAFDYAGNQVWAKNLGKPDNHYGYATSLAVYKNFLIIQFDEGDEDSNKSRIIALDTATGNEAWKTEPRPVGATWSSPIVVTAAQREQLLACGSPWLMSYNPDNGTELWRAKVCYGEVTPSPVLGAGFIITANETICATKPDGSGDVTKTHVAWKAEDGIPDICSPLCDGANVYVLTSSGILTCYDAQSGKKNYEKELELDFKASPSAAGGRLYLASEKEGIIVAQGGPEYKELARCSVGEIVEATPAFVEGRIYIRGKNHLFCLGAK